MRRFAIIAVFLALEGCGGVSLISLPKLPPKAPAVAPVPVNGPKDCPSDLTADLDAMPPVPADAWIPKPADPKAAAGWQVFLTYLGNDYAGYAAEGWRRAGAAKDWCAGK